MLHSRPFPRKHEPAEHRERRQAEREANLRALAMPSRSPCSATYSGQSGGGPIEKENAIEHEGYRRLVAALPCKHCGIWGYSQCAHPNTGKAGGKKLIDDRLCFPLCTVHPVAGEYVQGCHGRFDQGALYTKAARREIEPAWGADTRRLILAAGLWPANLPIWNERATP